MARRDKHVRGLAVYSLELHSGLVQILRLQTLEEVRAQAALAGGEVARVVESSSVHVPAAEGMSVAAVSDLRLQPLDFSPDFAGVYRWKASALSQVDSLYEVEALQLVDVGAHEACG